MVNINEFKPGCVCWLLPTELVGRADREAAILDEDALNHAAIVAGKQDDKGTLLIYPVCTARNDCFLLVTYEKYLQVTTFREQTLLEKFDDPSNLQRKCYIPIWPQEIHDPITTQLRTERTEPGESLRGYVNITQGHYVKPHLLRCFSRQSTNHLYLTVDSFHELLHLVKNDRSPCRVSPCGHPSCVSTNVKPTPLKGPEPNIGNVKITQLTAKSSATSAKSYHNRPLLFEDPRLMLKGSLLNHMKPQLVAKPVGPALANVTKTPSDTPTRQVEVIPLRTKAVSAPPKTIPLNPVTGEPTDTENSSELRDVSAGGATTQGDMGSIREKVASAPRKLTTAGNANSRKVDFATPGLLSTTEARNARTTKRVLPTALCLLALRILQDPEPGAGPTEDILIHDFYWMSAVRLRNQLLTILPIKRHPLSMAANDLVACCVFQVLTGRWYFQGKPYPASKAQEYILQGWEWSQIWKTRFRKNFRDIVINAETSLQNGMSSLVPEVASKREEVWPVLKEPLVDDQTAQFIQKHFDWDSVIAQFEEGAM